MWDFFVITFKLPVSVLIVCSEKLHVRLLSGKIGKLCLCLGGEEMCCLWQRTGREPHMVSKHRCDNTHILLITYN